MLAKVYKVKFKNDHFENGADEIHLYRAHSMRLGFRHGLFVLG
jgi:hypothetical protein